jgi:KUP system potassium uptake protein
VEPPRERWSAALYLAALGIVFGDIGTSPLYALRQCFFGILAITPTAENVLGVLSLIFWSLALIISVKYLLFVMTIDNQGEGGIIALVAALRPASGRLRGRGQVLAVTVGVFGAALLYGDGTITPAISVLSAIEGLGVATSTFDRWILPLTLVILIALFFFQRRGTASIGSVFGPVMLLWFTVIAILGIRGIAQFPGVLEAVSPIHALAFFARNGASAFVILGTVFLVVTGGEALYANLGQFGLRPMRLDWFLVVLPALLLNYFGQGALLLSDAPHARQPFFMLAPPWALYPLVALATAATIIASQAVISGTFSLTRQAMQLGFMPRMRVVHTSADESGHVYVPFVNWTLMIATIALVLGFGSSTRLGGAYGVAVSLDMVITTLLAAVIAHRRGLGWPATVLVIASLWLIDVSFLLANLLKISDGGWYPMSLGIAIFTVMTTWRRGRSLLLRRLEEEREPLEKFAARVSHEEHQRLPGSAVIMTSDPRTTPYVLLQHYKRHRSLQETVIVLTVKVEEKPRVPASDRFDIKELRGGFYRVRLRVGYMQTPNVPAALKLAALDNLPCDPDTTTYYLGNETLIPTVERPGMALWRETLFAFLSRNALRATAFYHIPAEQVVELGVQIEI